MRAGTMRAIAFVLVPVLSGCAAGTNETLDWTPGAFVPLDKVATGWKGVSGDETFRFIYVKQDQTPDNWTDKAEVTQLPIGITLGSEVRWTPESVLGNEKARKQEEGCATDSWTTLQQDSSSILYEWSDIHCEGYLHQHEVGRIVMGKWYLWWLSYGIRNRELSADERATLIRRLVSAKVTGS